MEPTFANLVYQLVFGACNGYPTMTKCAVLRELFLYKITLELTFANVDQVVFGASNGNPNHDKVWSAKVVIFKSRLASQSTVKMDCGAD